MDKLEVLRKYFGHSSFRGGQEQLVDSILSGRDCLGIMPTGAGKSVCFQVPAIMLDGTTIVISPLISLMQDQINALRESGVSAACINSSQSEEESRETFVRAVSGDLKIIYVAPERLETKGFGRLCERLEIPLVAVDEAHCVSRWGKDFRPSYLKVRSFVNSLKSRPVVAAFTATATHTVRNDIAELLGLNEPLTLTTGFDRPNLYFEVRKPASKFEELLKIIRENSGSAIVYCATRRNVESVCEMLRENGVNAQMYHAGFSSAERKRAQDDFLYDRTDVMVATNAFGMGIDKSNVSLVVHYNMPKDIESYYQEAGRAGRDGSPARCVLLYAGRDVDLAEYMINQSRDSSTLPTAERNALYNHEIDCLMKMENYCSTKRCLRGFILDYFGEKGTKRCGGCSNCEADYKTADITVEAQKILSCVFRLRQRGKSEDKAVLARILTGSRDQKILADEYDTLSTYGIMKDVREDKICEIIDYLVSIQYLNVIGDKPELTEKADSFIKGGARLVMRLSSAVSQKKPAVGASELFERLRAARKSLSVELGIPPFVIFPDSTLRDMEAKKPRNYEEFLTVSGVGTMKAERYGNAFIKVIEDYTKMC